MKSAALGLLLLITTSLSCFAADTWKSIQTYMDEEEFKQAGLDKLNTQEIEHLNQWLKKYTAYTAPEIIATSQQIKKMSAKPRTFQIDGEFSGWKGKTIFRLTNGELWQQRLSENTARNLIRLK